MQLSKHRRAVLTVRMPHIGCETHCRWHVRIVRWKREFGFEEPPITDTGQTLFTFTEHELEILFAPVRV